MKGLLSDKRAYFAAFGAVGGLLSAIIYGVLGLDGAFSSWVVGTGFDGMCIGALLAFGQARYVGKSFDWKAFRKAMLIGGVGGLAGGFAALKLGFPIAEAFGGATAVSGCRPHVCPYAASFLAFDGRGSGMLARTEGGRPGLSVETVGAWRSAVPAEVREAYAKWLEGLSQSPLPTPR